MLDNTLNLRSKCIYIFILLIHYLTDYGVLSLTYIECKFKNPIFSCIKVWQKSVGGMYINTSKYFFYKQTCIYILLIHRLFNTYRLIVLGWGNGSRVLAYSYAFIPYKLRVRANFRASLQYSFPSFRMISIGISECNF